MRTPEEIEAAIHSLSLHGNSKKRYATKRDVREIVSELVSSSGIGRVTPVAATLLAGNAHATLNTNDTWLTVTPSIPANSAAILHLVVNSTDNADDGDLQIRTSASTEAQPGPEVVALAADARGFMWFEVNTDATGSFQVLFTNTSATTIDWAVTLIGYRQF